MFVPVILFQLKKPLSIFFLFIFLYNVIGYYAVFEILNYLNKEKIEQSIADNIENQAIEIIEIKKDAVLHSKDFAYTDDDEIKYQGKLYDIVKKVAKGDSIYFYCINDQKEEHLFANLFEHIKNQIDNSKSLPGKENKTVKIELVKDYFFNLFATNNYRKKESILYSQSDSFYTSFIKDITSPPPKEIVA